MTTVYRHSEPDVCRELAEKRSFRHTHQFTPQGFVYRFIDWRDENGEVQLGLIAYPIRSITESGLTIPFSNARGWKFIADHMLLRAYAHREVKKALENYVRRKQFHVQYLEAKLTRTRNLYAMAQNKPEPALNYELIEDFELANEPELLD